MYRTKVEPRVSETDGVGHINNTTIPVWLEAGRNPIFTLFTPDHSFENWRMIILNMNVDYVSQIYFGKDAEVLTWVNRIGNSSLELYEEIHQDGILCVKAKAVYVNFNIEKQKAETIPDSIRLELKKHLVEDTEVAAVSNGQ
ncbi:MULTISPECIES: thioesterase family protein [unclassified Planococcus (in: firmicutes)]|uniref:acyl-CoA thioesterase n=1 Tax=unclassified Planococcus (in: firmicutes) TaxID=2662419 RepID=UPI001F26D91F|nr:MULTISPECIES: thioesterase family protein [unclassified Planococcus (in: firmicutes)]UJF26702.1 acyl-CoA thioesterase [Planococcus sp. 107-1]GKW45913.1 thioesterase [Planococcus sp. NCCP-2050]